MMEEEKLIPKRRFKGFEEEWNTYNFGEKVEFFSGLTYSPKDVVSNNGTFVIRSSNIKNNQILDADNVYVDENIVNSEQVKVGDIIVVVRNGSRNLIGKNAVVREKMPDTVIGAFMTGIRYRYYNFNNALLNTKLFKRQVAKNLGATINQITTGMFNKMIFNYPKHEEQQKIGEFFKFLDERIANQERKIAKVKALKTAYLTEMFPQEGETVPKRRFKGFDEEWKKEKLVDIANFRRGSFPQPYGLDKWYDEANGMPFVQVVDVAKNLRLVNNTKQKISNLAQPKSVYVEEGKVLVTLQGSIGRVAITQYPSFVDRTLLIFESYKLKFDIYYFAYIIQLLFDIEKQKAPGGTIKTITIETLNEFIVKIPSYKEQQKIGSFFKNLDDQIATEEKKLAKLKKMKDAYLEEMFV